MICGYFQIQDLFYDEVGEDCRNKATHTSCGYGNVCEHHVCRCSKLLEENKMKKTQTREVDRLYSLENPTEPFDIVSSGPVIETQERHPIEGRIDLGPVIVKDGGFRVSWNG